MNYCHLIIQCQCGGIVKDNFAALLMTSEGILCFAGQCPNCGRVAAAGVRLAQLLVDSEHIPAVQATTSTDFDLDFLKRAHISLEGGEV